MLRITWANSKFVMALVAILIAIRLEFPRSRGKNPHPILRHLSPVSSHSVKILIDFVHREPTNPGYALITRHDCNMSQAVSQNRALYHNRFFF
jgi:hypothetical protein